MIERYFLDGRHAMGGEERLVRQAVRRSQDSSSGSGRRRQRVGEGEPDNSFLLLFIRPTWTHKTSTFRQVGEQSDVRRIYMREKTGQQTCDKWMQAKGE